MLINDFQILNYNCVIKMNYNTQLKIPGSVYYPPNPAPATPPATPHPNPYTLDTAPTTECQKLKAS